MIYPKKKFKGRPTCMLLTLIFQFYHISCLVYFFNMLIRISRPTGSRLSLGLLGLDYNNWPTVNLQIG